MPILKSCCCWSSLRKGCYASSFYTFIYYVVTIGCMVHFIEFEHKFLAGHIEEPVSKSFLESDKISQVTVFLNIMLIMCSSVGIVACLLLAYGIYTDNRYLLLPWLISMVIETIVEIINVIYLFYLQMLNFNPVTSFLFTMDFFIVTINIYAMMCVISQYQEYSVGRGTAEFDRTNRTAAVQYTTTQRPTTTTSSALSGRRRSAGRPIPCRCEPEDFSEVPSIAVPSVLSKPTRSAVKKHVQFPDEHSCLEEVVEEPRYENIELQEIRGAPVMSSLWAERESPEPERCRRRSEQYYRPVNRFRQEQRKLSVAGVPPADVMESSSNV